VDQQFAYSACSLKRFVHFSDLESATFSAVHVLPPVKNKGILGGPLTFSAHILPEAIMLVTRKLTLIAIVLLFAGCTTLPTDSDAAASAPADRQTSVAPSDSESVGTTSTSGDTDGRGGNLFGSGT
jgi:hypothetical protein